MQIKKLIILIAFINSLCGCYRTITGTVVDAETGKAIDGAVILVEWTLTTGLGHTATESYKVIEAVTDKDGKASLAGNILNPFVNRPHLTVYKKGYVAWNNEYIFPDYKKRENFSWSNGYVFRLGRFKDSYSHVEHDSFVGNAIRDQLGTEKKHLFIELYEKAEREKVIRERTKK